MDAPPGGPHTWLHHPSEAVMKKVTPYFANGSPKTCWGCGQPFVVREGRAEAIVGASGRLYCHRTGCEETALLSHVHRVPHASVLDRAA
jgi:hypothetical protein